MSNSPIPDDLILVADVCERFNVSRDTIRRAFEKGTLQKWKVFGRVAVRESDLSLVIRPVTAGPAEPVPPPDAESPYRHRSRAEVLARLRARGHKV